MTNQEQAKQQNEIFKQRLTENLFNRIDSNVPLTRSQREGIKGIINQVILKEIIIQDGSNQNQQRIADQSKPKKAEK